MANDYIQLKIVKTTAYHGRILVPNEKLTVDIREANRLIGQKLAEVIDEVIEQTADDELDSMNLDELREYAQEAGVNLKGITRKADVIATIRGAV